MRCLQLGLRIFLGRLPTEQGRVVSRRGEPAGEHSSLVMASQEAVSLKILKQQV